MGDLGFTFTWYGHSCLEIETPGGRRHRVRPVVRQPDIPEAADEVDRCDVLLVTPWALRPLDVGDALGVASRLRPAWPCIHELSLWLAVGYPAAWTR